MTQEHRKPPRKGKNWRKDHSDHGVLASSTAQRKAVWVRDNGKCCDCGSLVSRWDADHDTPLHSITQTQLADYPACLKYWSIGNLKTRGVSCGCHTKKSAKERTAQAKVIRIVKKASGIRKPGPFRPVPKKWVKKAVQKAPSKRAPVICHLNLVKNTRASQP